eukprot:3949776-Prymnesium_polylepis.1
MATAESQAQARLIDATALLQCARANSLLAEVVAGVKAVLEGTVGAATLTALLYRVEGGALGGEKGTAFSDAVAAFGAALSAKVAVGAYTAEIATGDALTLVASARDTIESTRKAMLGAVGGDGSKAAGLCEVSDLWEVVQGQNGNFPVGRDERVEEKVVRDLHAALYALTARQLPPLDLLKVHNCTQDKSGTEGREPTPAEATIIGELLVMGLVAAGGFTPCAFADGGPRRREEDGQQHDGTQLEFTLAEGRQVLRRLAHLTRGATRGYDRLVYLKVWYERVCRSVASTG